MRKTLMIAALGALTLGSTAALADWHKPYIYRQSNGDWLRYEYNDGVCYYTYERYNLTQRPYIYSSGDCSQVNFVTPETTAIVPNY